VAFKVSDWSCEYCGAAVGHPCTHFVEVPHFNERRSWFEAEERPHTGYHAARIDAALAHISGVCASECPQLPASSAVTDGSPSPATPPASAAQ
jgi:hypothetical protein